MERNEVPYLRESVKQHDTQPATTSAFLTEAIENYTAVMAEAVERIKQLEQQLAQTQRAADGLGDRLRAVEMENTTLRDLLERWAVWNPVATDDQGRFCALCGGEEDPSESPETFKHTERCPVRPTRAFLAEHPDLEEADEGRW
jgi:hypothetical protein